MGVTRRPLPDQVLDAIDGLTSITTQQHPDSSSPEVLARWHRIQSNAEVMRRLAPSDLDQIVGSDLERVLATREQLSFLRIFGFWPSGIGIARRRRWGGTQR
jgi:hypothetical protein